MSNLLRLSGLLFSNAVPIFLTTNNRVCQDITWKMADQVPADPRG